MDWQPIHEVKVEHTWQEIGRSTLDSGLITVFRECWKCGEEEKALELGSVDKRSLFDLPKEEMQAELERMNEGFQKFQQQIEESNRELLDDTGCDDIYAFLADIERRYQRLFLAGEIPYKYLKMWKETSNKKARLKLLLLTKQGFVCNRCDQIVPSSGDLTIDHIRPKSEGGDLELTNLQLLCGPCNENKGIDRPTKLDVSPFSPLAKPCKHQISCSELDRLRQSREAN